MEIKETKIGKYVFPKDSDRIKFRIPDYQRPYVWDESRVEDFWKDLVDENEINLSFLGSFIFQESESSVYDIVDGQQRIITLSILLSVLRNIAQEIPNATLVENIQKRLTNTDDLGREKDHFLQCWEDVQSFYCEHILSKNGNIIQSNPSIKRREVTKFNMINNYKFLYELAKEFVSEANQISAEKIQNVLERIDKYSIVYIKVKTDEEAYTAFEIVNARGQELGNIDLLKNLFYKKAAHDQNKKTMVNRWESIIKNIDECSVNIEIFLKHFWYSKFGGTRAVSSQKLYREIKNLISDSANSYDELTIEILDNSKVYRSFFELQEYDWTGQGKAQKYNLQILKYLKHLRGFKVTQAYVLFLSLIRNKEKIGSKKVRNIIRAVEKFHFAYSAVSKLQANKVEKLYGKYAEDFNNAEGDAAINRIYANLINKLNNLLPTALEFQERFESIEYKSANKDLIRFIFDQYETILRDGHEDLEIDFTNANIEHIHSQNPIAEEEQILDDESSLHKIGNLMILSIDQNSRVSNAPVSEKIKIYEGSQLKIVREVFDTIVEGNNSWTSDNIKERTKKIAVVLYKNLFPIAI